MQVLLPKKPTGQFQSLVWICQKVITYKCGGSPAVMATELFVSRSEALMPSTTGH